jgi:hypothetical protein
LWDHLRDPGTREPGKYRFVVGRNAGMLDHTGQRRVRYEDTFRALGHYLDANKFTQVSIVETPEGFLVKGYVMTDDYAGYYVIPTTYLFTNEDVDMLLETAYGRRRR